MKRKKRKYKLQDELWGTLFAGIPVLGLLIFTFIPLGMAVGMSFVDMQGMTFSGATALPLKDTLKNYTEVLSDGYFWNAIKHNVIMLIELPISIILSVVIAELLSKKVRLTNFFKVILFVPYVCSVTATTFMWNWLLNDQYGLVNKLFGLDVSWIGDEKYFIWAIMIMALWSSSGYRILLFTAAITNVNGTLKEAARIDGANPFHVFVHVTLPAITPTIFYVLVMGMIGIFQEFTRIQVLNPNGTMCMTIVFYIFNKAFSGTPQLGQACAASIILALIIALLTKLNFTMSRKWVTYDVE